MKRNVTRQLLAALIVAAGLLTALPIAAQKPTTDISEWNENTSFGQNGANTTTDGYSQWDGHSFQNYGFAENGDIEIRNAAQLARYAWDMYQASSKIRNDRKQRNVHLYCDIDLDGYYFSITRDDYGMDCATFDGHGHTIRNGYAVECGDYQGLFAYIKGSNIFDLVLKDYHVQNSNAKYAGILCGYAYIFQNGAIKIKDVVYYGCTIKGVRVIDCTLNGDATYAGGMVGMAYSNFYSEFDKVSGGNADFITPTDDHRMQLCDNLVLNCTISTTDNVAGGLVGYAYILTLYRNRVINTSVYGEDDYAGGLVGRACDNGTIIDNLVLNCTVGGDDSVGGAFASLGYSYHKPMFWIANNIVHASVNGNTDHKAAFFDYCVASELSGLHCYYNTDYSGSLIKYNTMEPGWNEHPEPMTTTEMLDLTVPYRGSKRPAFKTMARLWPQLVSNYNNDNVITTAAGLKALAEEVNCGRYDYEGRVVRLGADIDMTDVSMPPIGTAEHPFMGEFNGQGHTISNLTINAQQDNVGLFGCLMNAHVHNVHIDGANVTGKNHVGVLFGTTIFSPCYIKDVLVENANVNGLGSVGGIGGRVADNKNIAYATIERCYYKGSVTTAYANTGDAAWAGGIAGNVLRGVISDCGCIATITRSTEGELKAGLIGGSNGTMTVNRCYAVDGSNNRLNLIAGRGTDASVTENNCPETIANGNSMQSDLGDNWFYFTEATDLPVPASLGIFFNDNAYVIEGDFVFYPNNFVPNQEPTSYYVLAYTGTGGDDVTIPANVNGKPVTKINYEVFNQRDDVTGVSLPEGIEYIGNKAFAESGITSISLPNSITGVGDMAFASCPALTSISIGTGVSAVSSNSFSNCPNLASITVDAGNTALKAIGDVLFSASGTTLYVCAAKGATSGDYVVPAGVKFVNDNAFAHCTKLTSITFPASLVSTDDDLFIGCDNLRFLDFTRCNNWEQNDSWLSTPGVTVNRNPTPTELLNITKSFPFAGLSEQTIIYMPADKSHANGGEKNVVIGNVGTELVLTDGWDFDPKVAFSFTGSSYDRYFGARPVITAEPQVDGNGDPVYELDSHGDPVLEFVYDEQGNHLYEEDNVTYKTQPVQAQTVTYSEEEKGYTVCLPFGWTLNLEENSEAKVYAPSVIEDIEGVTTVTFSQVQGSTMTAYTPYYIVVSNGGATVTGQGGSVTAHQTADTTDIDGASYQFKGSTATIPNTTLYDANKPAYILQSDGWWHKVPQNEPLAYVGPFRAYFQATSSVNVKALATNFIQNDETGATQIRTIDSDGTERYFDLSGRLLPSRPAKGIYFHNGKKYINK